MSEATNENTPENQQEEQYKEEHTSEKHEASQENDVDTSERQTEEDSQKENTTKTKPKESDKNAEPEKEKASKFEIKNNIFKENVQIGDNNTIVSQDRHGLPTKLDIVENEKVFFKVQKEATHCIDLLEETPFAVLNCAHHGIAASLKQTIARNSNFSEYLIYEVSFDNYDRSDILHLIEDCRKKILTSTTQKLLLFIHDSKDNKIPVLLRSLRKENHRGKEDILKKLDTSISIVYTTYHNDAKYLQDSPFEFHQVNVFEIYTKTYNLSEDQVHIIRSKQKENFWSKEDKYLLKDLDKIIEEPDFHEILRSEQKSDSTDFLKILRDKEKPLGRYVLFIATLFSELSPDKFREYVSVLIQKKKKVLVGDKKVSLIHLWDEDADFILDECELEAFHRENQYYIDFTTSTKAEKCERILFKKYASFIDLQARILIENQQLFTLNASFQLHYKIHPIIAKLSNYFGNYYGNELLKEWLGDLESQRGRIIDLRKEFEKVKQDRKNIISKIKEFEAIQNIKDEEDSLRRLRKIAPIEFKQAHDELLGELQMIKFLFYKEERLPENISIASVLEELYNLERSFLNQLHEINNEYNKSNYLLNRNTFLFVHLLTTIHENDNTKEIISNFFASTFEVVYMYYIIFSILTKFQIKNPSFQSLEFYKQSLAHNNKDVNEISINTFSELLSKEPSLFYSYFTEIKKWFPEISTHENDFTKLEKHALTLLFKVINEQKKYDVKRNGIETYLDLPVYKALFENKEVLNKELKSVLRNLFNLKKLYGNDSKIYQNQLAVLLSYWFRVLKNIQTHHPDQKVDDTITFLIQSLIEVLDKQQYKRLLFNLKEKRFSYNEILSRVTDKKEKNKLKKERDILIEFITLLKA